MKTKAKFYQWEDLKAQKKENVKKWLKENMHSSIKEIVPKLNIKLKGHFRYYGMFDNFKALQSFTRFQVEALYRALRRRGQNFKNHLCH